MSHHCSINFNSQLGSQPRINARHQIQIISYDLQKQFKNIKIWLLRITIPQANLLKQLMVFRATDSIFIIVKLHVYCLADNLENSTNFYSTQFKVTWLQDCRVLVDGSESIGDSWPPAPPYCKAKEMKLLISINHRIKKLNSFSI